MPFIGLITYFFCLYIRPQDWIPLFLDLPVDYIVFAFIFLTGIFQRSAVRFGTILRMKQTRFMIYWIVAIFLSNFVNGQFEEAFDFLFKYIKFLVIFFAFSLYIDSFKKMTALILFMIVLTAALSFQGMYQKQHGIGWAGQPLGWLDRIVWVGLWDGMNVLCLLFVVSFPFLLQFTGKMWSWRTRLLSFIGMPIIMIGIYLTDSRGGFMSLLSVFALHFRARVRSVIGVVLGLGVLGALIVFSPSRFGDFNDEDNSASGRVDMWREAFDMVRYQPVLGIGKGRFAIYTGRLIAHNSFLEVMGETGVVGLFLWLSLLYVSLKGLFEARALAENDQEKSIMEGLLICIVGYIFTSFFITAEFELLYVLLALALVATRLKNVSVRYSFADFRNVIGIQVVGMTGFFILTRIYYQVF